MKLSDKILEVVWDSMSPAESSQEYLTRKGYTVLELDDSDSFFNTFLGKKDCVYIKLYRNSTREWLELPMDMAEKIVVLGYLP
jgi:hypothetical protein